MAKMVSTRTGSIGIWNPRLAERTPASQPLPITKPAKVRNGGAGGSRPRSGTAAQEAAGRARPDQNRRQGRPNVASCREMPNSRAPCSRSCRRSPSCYLRWHSWTFRIWGSPGPVSGSCAEPSGSVGQRLVVGRSFRSLRCSSQLITGHHLNAANTITVTVGRL